ncbi:MAG: ABC transporter substrate-binding protein, partial [Chloroflexota bacterium]|nr:ABC transporter substrate-binding protein [Chloroflexota bacterium]
MKWTDYGLLLSGAVLLASCGGTPSASPSVSSPSARASAPSSASARAKPAASSAPAAGSASASAAPAGSKSPIKIGSLQDMNGAFASLGAEVHLSTDIVVNQINSTGGIDGHPVQVLYADPRSDPAQALDLATQLVQRDHVDVLMGANPSSECLGVSRLAGKLGVVFVPTTGCATDVLTTQNCNAQTFRVFPNSTQTLDAETATLVAKYGKTWGVFYPDYAFGQSLLKAFDGALKKVGGEVKVKIATPINEPNLEAYVSKIPTDGSIAGLLDAQGGADLVRGLQAMQRFGVLKKLPLVLGSGGREFFGGVYPSIVDGAMLTGIDPSQPRPDNAYEKAFQKAFSEMATKQPSIAALLGGVDKATPGTSAGYGAYLSMTALKQAMKASHFSGKAD